MEIDPAALHYSEIKLISTFHHTPRFIREALEAIRRARAEATLRRVASTSGLSRDVTDIVARTLAAN